jgi:hypothetical protein
MWLVVVVGMVAFLAGLRWAVMDLWLDRVGAPFLDWRRDRDVKRG